MKKDTVNKIQRQEVKKLKEVIGDTKKAYKLMNRGYFELLYLKLYGIVRGKKSTEDIYSIEYATELAKKVGDELSYLEEEIESILKSLSEYKTKGSMRGPKNKRNVKKSQK